MQILNKVKEYIQVQELLTPNDKIIVGLSGGADSVALLHILKELGYNCVAAHCNFHLRSDESNRDFEFVQKMCSHNNIEFTHIDFDTYEYMSENSVSLEMAARELRYAWFEEVKTNFTATKIAVAHHLDDSIETFLINLVRGTGIKGLTGIAPINGNIVRPLLCLYRDEVIRYLSHHNLQFVEDSTNKEDIYTRNKIRLNIIPLLETINPSAKQSISRTIENLYSAEKIYKSSIDKISKQIFINNSINIDLLLQQIEPKTILFEILHPYGFNTDNIENILGSLKGISGKKFYSKEYVLIKDRSSLIIEKLEERDTNIYTLQKNEFYTDKPISLQIDNIESMEVFKQTEKNAQTLFVDKSKLTFPLTIRRWMKGDKFVPLGMKGSKKISDYFSDRKMSIADKDKIWLLCSDNKIVWIIGERSDDRFKITEATKEIIKISLR